MINSIVNTEILQIVESVAREKNIQKELIIEAMEQAIESAAKRKYGHEHNIKVTIDKKIGEIKLFRILKIVEEVTNIFTEISLQDAIVKDSEVNYEDSIYEPLPPIDLGRVAAQTAKGVIVQKVKEIESERQFNEFKDREGEIINAIIKRIEYGNIIADLGHGTEALLRKDSMIPNENFRLNDRIRAYIQSVKLNHKGLQIILSRTANEFLAKLFTQEVPEIYDNIIQIKSVAREPGSRAKISVFSAESNIDPVGSCVGVRGSRVQAVIAELQGEKIDIVQWSQDPASYIVNALAPAEVSKVVIDENRRKIAAIVANEQLSLAIGRRGQNVRLASQLTGWSIDVLTEDEESKRRIEEFNTVSELFIKSLNVEEVLAQLLAAEGFTTIEEIAYTDRDELLAIEGFDEDLAEALKQRANEYLDSIQEDLKNKLRDLGVTVQLQELLNLDFKYLIILAEENIKTISNFADLSTDDFFDIVKDSPKTVDEINSLIMQARDTINLG